MKVKEPVYKRAEALAEEINKNKPSESGDSFQDAGITQGAGLILDKQYHLCLVD